jgi:hypothetical protein
MAKIAQCKKEIGELGFFFDNFNTKLKKSANDTRRAVLETLQKKASIVG